MILQQWASPCGNQCTNKYAALTKIPCNVTQGSNIPGSSKALIAIMVDEVDGEYSAKRVVIQMERHGKNMAEVVGLSHILGRGLLATWFISVFFLAHSEKKNGKSLEDCDHICYKDPVLKDQQWTAYIDRSPGLASYSEECFHACVSGCGYKFEVKPEEADKVCPNRQPKPETEPAQKPKPQPVYPIDPPGDIPGTSA